MRYSRQEIFLGKKSQKILSKSKVAIVGLGALGTVSAELLTRSGVNLTLIDRDLIELTNLQRQTLFSEKDINKPKVLVAEKKLRRINSEIVIKSHFINLDFQNVNLLKSEVILDCTDNLETRFLINEFSVKNRIPFIYASAIKNNGYVFNVLNKPCLKCILKNSKTTETCETTGVLNTITSMMASIQVNEAVKILTRNNPEKDLIYLNLENNALAKIKVNPDKNCPVCNGNFEYLSGKKQQVNNYCSTFIFKEKFDYDSVKLKLKKLGAGQFQKAIIFNKLTIFPDSVIIKTSSEKEAKSLYSRYIGN